MNRKSPKPQPPSDAKAESPNQKPSKWQVGRMANLAVVPGKKYGAITVEKVEKNIAEGVCECGTPWKGPRRSLSSGNTKSCVNCRNRRNKTIGLKHGHKRNLTPTKLYRAWQLMKDRCSNSKNPKWSRYGGRGISVCERWQHGNGALSGFECFAQDMGEAPTAKHTIERVNNNLGYCQTNCRWATRKEQGNNRHDNAILTAFGKTQTLHQWADELGMSVAALTTRYYNGWSHERTLSQPVRRKSVKLIEA